MGPPQTELIQSGKEILSVVAASVSQIALDIFQRVDQDLEFRIVRVFRFPGECGTCFTGVGVIDASGRAVVRSALNADLVENEYFPDIAVSPDGHVYVIATEQDEILRVVR